MAGRCLSPFKREKGILFAADISDPTRLRSCISQILNEIVAIKIGNVLAYQQGPKIVEMLKSEFGCPILADLKITDVGHVATQIGRLFAQSGADAITVSGVCGANVLRQVRGELPETCEVWLFTQFTDPEGLIDDNLANESISVGLLAGATGFQTPGLSPSRIAAVRAQVGDSPAIVCCGMGVQGGQFGAALAAGADLEIIGRDIYDAPSPREAAQRIRRQYNGS